jgi:glycosyltransferase involved in cell wall biosynthesis
MKILYLYSEVMGYTIATIDVLASEGAEVHLVYWDHKKLTPYRLPQHPMIVPYKRSEHTLESLTQIFEGVRPDITVVSGWMDRTYVAVARRLRREGYVVVTCLDNRWTGSLKQRLATALGALGVLRRIFSHVWVSGVQQYEYARKLGFRHDEIIYDMYSADVRRFRTAGQAAMDRKSLRYPRRLLFVGRFEPVKGLDTLLQAWSLLDGRRGGWELHLVGNGSLRDRLEAAPGVVVKEFMQPDRLVGEISEAGCVVLPSRDDPWGVVVHEFAAAGLPLVISDAVGAGTMFLIPGMNGYRFKVGDAVDLARAIKTVIDHTDQELLEMGRAAAMLAGRITPETSAGNLMSVVRQRADHRT